MRRLGSKDKITIPSLVWEVSAPGCSATWYSAAGAVHKTRHPGLLKTKVGWGETGIFNNQSIHSETPLSRDCRKDCELEWLISLRVL